MDISIDKFNELRKIMLNADIARLNCFSNTKLPKDEYDSEIKIILKKINEDITIFELKQIIYEVYKECFHEYIIYDKNDKIYNKVAKEIKKIIEE